jgi:hypothetical protein
VSAILGIALADWRARTRSFAFLIVAALVLEFAYLFVPDRNAGYSTVMIGTARGIYNAAWMGGLCALCSTMLLAFVGFYLVRGSLGRDERVGTAEIVAAAPVTRLAFVAGKWASNLAILAFISALLVAGCAVMQQVRGEARALDAGAYLVPFALVVMPTCALIAAVAVLFDALRPLRGVWGSVAWFFIMPFAIAVPLSAPHHSAQAAIDPFGIVPLVDAMSAAAHTAFPAISSSDVAVGVSATAATQTFVWAGMHPTLATMASRLVWIVVAVTLVGVASIAFDRFAAPRVRSPRAARRSIASFVPTIPGLRLVRAELDVLAGSANSWLLAALAATAIAGAFVPRAGLLAAVVPIALLLPLPFYGMLSGGERRGIDALVLSAPHAVTRTVVARIVAAGLLGTIPLAGAIVHLPALAVVGFASAALAMAIGRISGTPRAFEALYIGVWYVGALNHLPVADVSADAVAAPLALVLTGSLAVVIAAAGSRALLRRS